MKFCLEIREGKFKISEIRDLTWNLSRMIAWNLTASFIDVQE